MLISESEVEGKVGIQAGGKLKVSKAYSLMYGLEQPFDNDVCEHHDHSADLLLLGIPPA